ncbi:hypothetical protein Leucomu_05920 [Leucobacter muris]|uniref:DUF3263 domain-containing protein n=1 Tax=Leucobacter muris TaxID=1935379 RepID=A0ABX5QEX4_9MICO|nr:hypothetical protein Leucomu_05920 [Leucobacter muris]
MARRGLSATSSSSQRSATQTEFDCISSVVARHPSWHRRDFSSVMQMVATRYDLITEPELVHEARRVLTESVQK